MTIYERAIEHFGVQAQVAKALEELGELISALGRNIDNQNRKNVCEEIADCHIMLTQLRVIYGKDDVDRFVETKLKRLERLISK